MLTTIEVTVWPHQELVEQGLELVDGWRVHLDPGSSPPGDAVTLGHLEQLLATLTW